MWRWWWWCSFQNSLSHAQNTSIKTQTTVLIFFIWSWNFTINPLSSYHPGLSFLYKLVYIYNFTPIISLLRLFIMLPQPVCEFSNGYGNFSIHNLTFFHSYPWSIFLFHKVVHPFKKIFQLSHILTTAVKLLVAAYFLVYQWQFWAVIFSFYAFYHCYYLCHSHVFKMLRAFL